MRPETYELLAARQETYWWHRARREMAVALLRRFGLASQCRWLDVGCGPGGNLTMLDCLNPKLVVGVDVSPIALSLAKAHAPSVVLVRADVNQRLPFADSSFDIVTIFNVLYHQWIENESHVLAEVARVLSPSGLLLLTEPAFRVLAREMDDAVMTRRRYHKADFDPWLEENQFETLFSSYFTSFGFPILMMVKCLSGLKRTRKVFGALDMRQLPWVVNEALTIVAKMENWILAKGIRLPFGTTLVYVARRRAA